MWFHVRDHPINSSKIGLNPRCKQGSQTSTKTHRSSMFLRATSLALGAMKEKLSFAIMANRLLLLKQLWLWHRTWAFNPIWSTREESNQMEMLNSTTEDTEKSSCVKHQLLLFTVASLLQTSWRQAYSSTTGLSTAALTSEATTTVAATGEFRRLQIIKLLHLLSAGLWPTVHHLASRILSTSTTAIVAWKVATREEATE